MVAGSAAAIRLPSLTLPIAAI
jgi:hypothetical protein